MNKILIFLIITFCFTSIMAFSQNIEIPGPYKWEKRILLIFSAEESAIQKEQLEVFQRHQEGLKERDLVIFEIKEANVDHPDGRQYGAEAADKLRNQYKIPKDQFSVILIGKDGSEKLRQNEVLSAEKLFAVIDSMPMRKQEIRRNAVD